MKPFCKNSFLPLLALGLTFGSCQTLKTDAITYQSVRSAVHKTSNAPEGSEILVAYTINNKGELNAIVRNLTDKILVIDQTKSFFVNSDGSSISYFDPTIRTTSTTDLSSSTKGASVNLGAVASALGIGGKLGGLLGGVNVGGSGTSGTSITNATYIADQPQVSVGPFGTVVMSKSYTVKGLTDKITRNIAMTDIPRNESYCKFSVCISYSTDEGATYKKLITDMYANSMLYIPVTKHGRLNDALRTLYETKTDAINEDIWIIRANHTYKSYVNNHYTMKNHIITEGVIFDFQ